MRSVVLSLLTLLLLAGSYASAQVTGPVDPTGLQPRRFKVGAIRYELLLPPQASWQPVVGAPGTVSIRDNAKPKYPSRHMRLIPPGGVAPVFLTPARYDRAVTLASGNVLRYHLLPEGQLAQLRGIVEISGHVLPVLCVDWDDTLAVPEWCIAYLHHLKAIWLTAPIATCAGIELFANGEAHCVRSEPSPIKGFKDCPACPEMVIVPAGSFTMGSPADETGRESGEDQVGVTIARPFAVGRFAVTHVEWEACLDGGGCLGHSPPDHHGWGRGKRPVIVNWHAARAYVDWLSKTTGKRYRLPSEAEREYVTRAGMTTPYWWGSSISGDQANYDGRYAHAGGVDGVWINQTVPVDSFAPNPWGLYGVHGNIWEWTEDCQNDSNVGNPGDGTARTIGDCTYRIIRGGSWYSNAPSLRAAARGRFLAGEPDPAHRAGLYSAGNAVGFRVVRNLD